MKTGKGFRACGIKEVVVLLMKRFNEVMGWRDGLIQFLIKGIPIKLKDEG